jgi:hypothetical protein
MEAYKLRQKLLLEISNADEVLLKVVEDAIETYNHTHIPMVSEPMSVEEYNREYEIAEKQIANGDVFTQEEVTEIIKRWGRK